MVSELQFHVLVMVTIPITKLSGVVLDRSQQLFWFMLSLQFKAYEKKSDKLFVMKVKITSVILNFCILDNWLTLTPKLESN